MTIQPAIPLIDREGALERIGGDAELYDEVVQIFLEDVPVQLGILREALASGDLKVGERQAHSLKSAAANIGAEAMKAVCFQAEKAFPTAKPEDLKLHVDSMSAEFERVKNYFASNK